MRFQPLFIFLALAIIAGCSGITVSQDYDQQADFAVFKTYAWKQDPAAVKDDEAELSPLVAARIRNAIATELEAKGISYSDTSADFLVDYNLKVESKISSSNVQTSIGFGTGGYRSFGAVGISSAPDIRQYDEGTLYIDFYASDNNKLVWRGISSQAIDKHEDPDKLTEQINLNVQKILEQYPPGASRGSS
jgi:hypothetical protein